MGGRGHVMHVPQFRGRQQSTVVLPPNLWGPLSTRSVSHIAVDSRAFWSLGGSIDRERGVALCG